MCPNQEPSEIPRKVSRHILRDFLYVGVTSLEFWRPALVDPSIRAQVVGRLFLEAIVGHLAMPQHSLWRLTMRPL